MRYTLSRHSRARKIKFQRPRLGRHFTLASVRKAEGIYLHVLNVCGLVELLSTRHTYQASRGTYAHKFTMSAWSHGEKEMERVVLGFFRNTTPARGLGGATGKRCPIDIADD